MRWYLEEYGIWAFIGAVVVLGLVAAYFAVQEQQRWLAECEADGNPGYVCEERWAKAHPPTPQNNVTVHSH